MGKRIEVIDKITGEAPQLYGWLAKMKRAAFTQRDINLCNKRYMESERDFGYDEWCISYIALNSTKRIDMSGNVIDGKKRFKLGSYQNIK